MSERGTDDVTKAVQGHHAELWAELTTRGDAVIEAVARGADPEPSRGELFDYLTGQVVPHLAVGLGADVTSLGGIEAPLTAAASQVSVGGKATA